MRLGDPTQATDHVGGNIKILQFNEEREGVLGRR